MLKTYRWQIIALLVSIILFGVAIVLRFSGTESPSLQPTTPPIAQQPETTSEPTTSPTSTPQLIQQSPPTVITYREGLAGEVKRLNPLFADLNPVDADITALIFEGLTRVNAFGEIEPALAKNWLVSFDGLEYVVQLRDDVLWHDGVPFTAQDVVYTIDLLQSPDFPGSDQLNTFWRTVEVQAIDPYLIRFRLAQPLASFPDALRIGILPYHALEGTTAAQLANHPFNLDPIGTGAYQLEGLHIDDGTIKQVDLRVAPNFRLRPEGQTGYALERISFRIYDTFDAILTAISAGELDAYASNNRYERPALMGQTRLIPYTGYEPTIGFLVFNWDRANVSYFKEARVRQALALGLNRDSIIERNFFDPQAGGNVAVVANSPLLPLSWAYSYGDDINAYWVYDPFRAATELQTASERIARANQRQNETDATELVSFTFAILTRDDPALVGVAQEIAAQWNQLSTLPDTTFQMNITVDVVDAETYYTRLTSGDFDTVLVELSQEGNADPDVYAFWHQGQYPNGQNYGGANDTAISQALELARQDVNGTNRAIHYNNFQRAFIERAVALPLYIPLFTYAVNPDVTGIQIGFIGASSDRFMTIRDWRME
ncbi:MAG: hypothetical protein D6711_07285 [Chloroflexi bacterium]|nr:MAG: hypothetical protein D6711_07285 [Chloroflexota bacterium]